MFIFVSLPLISYVVSVCTLEWCKVTVVTTENLVLSQWKAGSRAAQWGTTRCACIKPGYVSRGCEIRSILPMNPYVLYRYNTRTY